MYPILRFYITALQTDGTLINQGYRYSDLCKPFSKFAKRYTQIMNKYRCSIQKHIEDGISLPVLNKFLSRHISCK